MSVMIYGCGYLGLRAARRWRSAGRTVHTITRSPQRAAHLRNEGIQTEVVDILNPPAAWRPPLTETVLFSLGFDRTPTQSLSKVYQQGLRHAWFASGQPAARWIYISTTGVYGEGEGAALDEQSPCRPQRAGGQASLHCEQFLGLHAAAGCWILRMAGLYGPGRVPRAEDLVQGRPLAALPDSLLNLIHIDDAAAIVVQASQTAPQLCEIVNISDGHPVTRRDFYSEAARLLNAPAPQFVAPQGQSRGASTGKIINSHKRELRLPAPLQFPTYREGLASIFS